MLNSSGEKVHPCLVPDFRGNDLNFSPLLISFLNSNKKVFIKSNLNPHVKLFTESKLCIGSEEAEVWPYCHVSLFLSYYLNSKWSNPSLRGGISYSGYHLNIIQFKQKMTIVTPKGRVTSDGADTKCKHFRVAGVGSELEYWQHQLVGDGFGSVRNSGFSRPLPQIRQGLAQLASCGSPCHQSS